MRALWLKELRENVRLLALGIVIFGVLLAVEHRDFNHAMKGLAQGNFNARGDLLQPLVSPLFLLETGFFCAIFGAVLGWFQMFNERHRDLWSFLVHRPMTRTGLLLGKAGAGLALYALGAGLPLAGFIAWARWPGHVAAPFEAAMLLPVIALFLLGIVFYLAGMLTGLRQARWYASRGIPLLAALLVMFVAIAQASSFWQALLVLLFAIACLAAAVWGAFQSNGAYRGQPAAGKAALTATLTSGATVVALLATSVLFLFLPHIDGIDSRWQYGMSKDGTVYKFVSTEGVVTDLVDLDGKPLENTPAGRSIDSAELNRRASHNSSILVESADSPTRQLAYMDSSRLFSLRQTTSGTLWYFWPRHGRLVAYDVATRRFLGSLGPESFARDLRGNGDRFSPLSSPAGGMMTDTVAYRLDLNNRRCLPLFTTTPGDPILQSANVFLGEHQPIHNLLVTRQFIRLLTLDGNVVWETPYDPGYPDYNGVMVSALEPKGQFAVWISPSHRAEARSGRKLPTRVTWFADGQAVKSVDLPKLPRLGGRYTNRDRLVGCSLPPAFLLASPWFFHSDPPTKIPWVMVRSGLVVVVVLCLPIGWYLGTRYRVPLPARLGWMVFLLLTGIPGLLAFLSAQEWPAREPCPQCGKPRVVDRELCEHCGAGFAPPEKKGTEIFEPQVATPR